MKQTPTQSDGAYPYRLANEWRWMAAIIVGLVVITLMGCAKPANQPMPVSQERVIPDGVCAKGDVGIWIDISTITCHKEIK